MTQQRLDSLESWQIRQDATILQNVKDISDLRARVAIYAGIGAFVGGGFVAIIITFLK